MMGRGRARRPRQRLSTAHRHYGLLGLAVAVFVLETLQSEASGLGVGLLVGSIGGWVWPEIGGASYAVFGVTLVVVGLVNAATTPYFRRLGERMAGR